MGDGASHDHGLDSSIQSLRPWLEGRSEFGFGNGRMSDALCTGEKKAGGKYSLLQRIARGRGSCHEKRCGWGDPTGGQTGLRW
jgi:hypothetical protein